MPLFLAARKALLAPYDPRRVLDNVTVVPVEFRKASAEATQRVRAEYKLLRPQFIAEAREEALELWGDIIPKPLLLKTIMADSYNVHHKHFVTLGGGNDTLVLLPADVHNDLHRRYNAAADKMSKIISADVHGSRAHPLTLEKKLLRLEAEGISERLAKKLAAIKGVAVSGNKITIDTPWPEGKILIPQLLPLEPAWRVAAQALQPCA